MDYTGNVVIRANNLETVLEQLSGITAIHGNLIARGHIAITLIDLICVKGLVIMEDGVLFKAPNLVRIKGDVILNNSAIMIAKQLATITANLELHGGSQLNNLVLNEVGGDLFVDTDCTIRKYKETLIQKTLAA